jgi:hypothetical protein
LRIGVRYGNISALWMSAVAVPFFCLSLWEYRVLTRPDVRALFIHEAAPTVERVGG